MGFTIYELKPRFQNLLRPVARALFNVGVTANHVTIAAMFFSVGLGAFLYFDLGARALVPSHSYAVALLPAFLFVRMALNAIDGMLAREFRQKSRLGAFLNEIGDVVSDVALYLPLAVVAPGWGAPIGLIVLLAVLGEFAGVISQALGATRRYDGPFGKSDRAFFFGLWAIVAGFVTDEANAWFERLLWIAALLALLTLVKRVRRALRELEGRPV